MNTFWHVMHWPAEWAFFKCFFIEPFWVNFWSQAGHVKAKPWWTWRWSCNPVFDKYPLPQIGQLNGIIPELEWHEVFWRSTPDACCSLTTESKSWRKKLYWGLFGCWPLRLTDANLVCWQELDLVRTLGSLWIASPETRKLRQKLSCSLY